MGKYVLSGLGLLSVIWIIYVGLNLVSGAERLSPASVYGKADASVVIIHKPLEVDYTEASFSFLTESNFYTAILTHTERIQHFYFSTSRKAVLLERSKPWTIELIKRYFNSLDVTASFTSAKKMTLSNGWLASYDKEFLYVFEQASSIAENAADQWKYVDRNASASLVRSPGGQIRIENVYLGKSGELSYIAQTNTAGEHLVDDQEIFQDVIPDNFEEYSFYESTFLKNTVKNKSAVFEWMNLGLVVVTVKGEKCIITDQVSGQDPIAILGDAVDESSISENKTKGFVKNVALPEKLTDKPLKDWYIEVFNDRVFIAENKSTTDAVIGSYEAGTTLSQNRDRKNILFSKVPQKVSYRHISATENRTISLLNRSKHTVVQKFTPEETTDEVAEKTKQLAPIRIDGGIAQLIPVQGSDFLFVLSQQNIVYGISGELEKWQFELEAKPLGSLSLTTTGNLVITTGDKLHVLTMAGAEQPGFPVELTQEPVSEAVAYSWKGAESIAVADHNQLTIYSSAGKKNTSVKLPVLPSKSPVTIWSNNGELTATIIGETKGVNMAIDRRRKRGEFPVPATALFAAKPNGIPVYYGIDNQQLTQFSTNGQTRAIDSKGATRIMAVEKSRNNLFLLVQFGKNLKVFSEAGVLLTVIQPSFNTIEWASLQSSSNGKTNISILDGLANNNYIYGLDGVRLTDKTFEGSRLNTLHRRKNGSLVLVSQSNGFLVRYPLN